MLYQSPSSTKNVPTRCDSGNPTLPERVVITGAGIATALGAGWEANSSGFQSGASGFGDVTLFPTENQRCRIAAEMKLPSDLDAFAFGARKSEWWRRWEKRSDRASRILMLAAREAFQGCGWSTGANIPIVLATTSGGMAMGERYLETALQTPNQKSGQPQRVLQYQPQRQALNFAEAVGSTGPQWIISNACASGGNAIGMAWEWIRSGRCERVWAGGYDSVSRMTFAGFDSLQALSVDRSKPLDKNRTGLGLGEGAAALAMESLTSARRRNANILGEIAGYAACHDKHHLTQPHPEGLAAAWCMTAACEKAGITPDHVDYINAHGTGTPLNDSAEAMGIQSWKKDCAKPIAVSSTKASVGHLLGAAGAVEAVVSLMALQGQWIPPTGSLEEPDPLFAGLTTLSKMVHASVEYVLSNSFGFGGANASLVLKRWES